MTASFFETRGCWTREARSRPSEEKLTCLRSAVLTIYVSVIMDWLWKMILPEPATAPVGSRSHRPMQAMKPAKDEYMVVRV